MKLMLHKFQRENNHHITKVEKSLISKKSKKTEFSVAF
jgi:hypothetical protein